MDPVTRLLMQGAAGAGGEVLGVEDVFSTWLYTGNGSTQTITNGIDLAGEGGLVWIKQRSSTAWHDLNDTVRGAGYSLYTNATLAQTSAVNQGFQGFNSNGFSIKEDALTTPNFNLNGSTYASWTFRKAEKFFDVVTYTGNGASTQTISHSLGSVPGSIIVKGTSAATDWPVYHRGLNGGVNPEQWYLRLNATAAQTNAVANWGNTAPTSTTFTVGGNNNVNGITYVAYLFAHDAGGFGDSGNESVVKCGTFTCDGSGNVGTVDLGWEPQWILTKKTNGTQNWYQWDNMRGWALTTSSTLSPNLSDAEVAMGGTSYLYPTATGFAGNGNFFGPSAQVIYIAIRRGPMKTPTDATKVFEAKKNITSSSPFSLTGPPYIDFIIDKRNELVGDPTAETRLLGATRLFTNLTNAESAGSANWGGATGTQNITPFNTGDNHVAYLFRRAPGFFDVVASTSTASSNQRFSHNLLVIPELIILKPRVSGSWFVYTSPGGRNKYLILNNATAEGTDTPNTWGTSDPTSTDFGFSSSTFFVTGTNVIAYLFASCPGVSKCFNYTGTGTTKQIDCGFTNGARLVLIKRTDSTGDWYIWDSARGIISGNDPYLLLNSTAAEVANTDYIDPYSAGFEISSTAPAAINANGGSYIGLAIA